MEETAEHLEVFVGVTQSVAVPQVEHFTVNFGCDRFLVKNNAALLLQISVAPDVVVAQKVMHLYAEICQFRELTQKSSIAFGHHIFIFVPEVEHVAQQVNGVSFVLDAVEKLDKPAFLRAA